MSMKKNIQLLIDILEKSKISTLEVSSFWGFRKVKLSKKISIASKESVYSNQDLKDVVSYDEKTEQAIPPSVDDKKEDPKPVGDIVQKDLNRVSIEAPLVGTVYLSGKPGEPQFVNENDFVKKGQVICIIEAMKIFNEIESDKEGIVRKILVKNEDPIEFGQPLIEIEPQ